LEREDEEYTELVANGVDIQSHQGVTYQIHHKYGVIDQGVSAADPMVFTGSHNWSSAGENNNDENTVFVHDEVIANQYYQEFMARYCELSTTCGSQPPGMEEYAPRTSFNIYPNPNAGVYRVEFVLAEARKANIRVMDMAARVVHADAFEALAGDNVLAINNDLDAGQYILELTIDGVASFMPLIIE